MSALNYELRAVSIEKKQLLIHKMSDCLIVDTSIWLSFNQIQCGGCIAKKIDRCLKWSFTPCQLAAERICSWARKRAHEKSVVHGQKLLRGRQACYTVLHKKTCVNLILSNLSERGFCLPFHYFMGKKPLAPQHWVKIRKNQFQARSGIYLFQTPMP